MSLLLCATQHPRHPASDRTMVGRLVCLDCDVVLGPLRICGQLTRAGRPCRTPIREDLGYRECWSHGEGRGRTSTPRRGRWAS